MKPRITTPLGRQEVFVTFTVGGETWELNVSPENAKNLRQAFERTVARVRNAALEESGVTDWHRVSVRKAGKWAKDHDDPNIRRLCPNQPKGIAPRDLTLAYAALVLLDPGARRAWDRMNHAARYKAADNGKGETAE
jgi:hypothetical protein